VSTLSFIAVATALIAVLGLFAGMPDRWFCALLALASLLGSAESAYRGRALWTVLYLIAGAMFAGASVHAAYTAGRERRQP
jgi:hypothetical protein